MNGERPPRVHPQAEEIRERLNRVRGNYSLRELAEGYRASSESIRRWLLGESCVPADFVAHICKRTGANPAWILLGIRPVFGYGFAEACFQALAEPEVRHRVSNALAELLDFSMLPTSVHEVANRALRSEHADSIRGPQTQDSDSVEQSPSTARWGRARRLTRDSKGPTTNGALEDHTNGPSCGDHRALEPRLNGPSPTRINCPGEA